MRGTGRLGSAARLVELVRVKLRLSWLEVLVELWQAGRNAWSKFAGRGMYEVLEYESTLELKDKWGKQALFRKREKVRYLQDNIIAFEDQAWGDGEILLDYKCSPGVPVDRYRLDHKTYILISLRELKNKGDVDEFNIEWKMRNGFLRSSEQWGTHVRRRIRKLKVSVVFPKSRPPLRTVILESTRQHPRRLGENSRKQLPDGRWQVTWQRRNPKLHETYMLEWDW